MLPKMPSLLSMAALQQQMLGKPPGGKIAFSEEFPLLTSILISSLQGYLPLRT